MSVNRVDSLAAVVVGSTILTQVRRKSINPAIQLVLEQMGGATQPSFAGLLQQGPMLSFGTTEIARMLGISGVGTIDIPGTAASVASYWGKVAASKSYAAGSAHDRERILAGMLIPRRIGVRQGQAADFDVDVTPIWDGTNNPIILDTNQALPTGVISQMFHQGPISISGSAISGCLGATLNFGFQIGVEFGDGDTWPTFTYSLSNSPTLELSFPSRAAFNTLGLSGGALTSTGAILYLRSIERNKKAYSDASLQHIKIQIPDGCVYPGQGSAEVARRGEFAVTVAGTTDGSNAALAITTGVAIS